MAEKLKTVILRMSPEPEADASPTAESVGRPGVTLTARPPVSLQVEALEDGERVDIAQEKDVIAVGISMPFTLIKPSDGGTAAATGDSWGIGDTGANGLGENAGAGVKVAVLDTGIAEHEAFEGVNPVLRNFTDEDDADIDGHGTHCAGTIFGRDVGGRRIGIARGVTEPLIAKVLGTRGGDSQSIMDAIVWAQSEGAKVISMSLGMDYPGFRQRLVAAGRHELEATSIALQAYRENVRLFDRLSAVYANALNVNAPLLIAASGNESNRPAYSIAAAPPSEADGILAVGAIDLNRRIARFSNTDPDCCAPGVDILSADHANYGGLRSLSGTSMATPHAAGAAVIHAQRLAQQGPFSAQDLRDEVMANCVPVPGLSRADAGRGRITI